jgi:hypothetical protein
MDPPPPCSKKRKLTAVDEADPLRILSECAVAEYAYIRCEVSLYSSHSVLRLLYGPLQAIVVGVSPPPPPPPRSNDLKFFWDAN